MLLIVSRSSAARPPASEVRERPRGFHGAEAEEVEEHPVASTGGGRRRCGIGDCDFLKCWLFKQAGLTLVVASSRSVFFFRAAQLVFLLVGKRRPWTEGGRSCQKFSPY